MTTTWVGGRRPVVITTAICLFITGLVTAARLAPALGEGRLHVGVLTLDDLHEGQVELAEAMVLILVGGLLWGRYLRVPTVSHLLLLTAVSVLAFDNLVSAVFTAGFDMLSASRFATWSTVWVGLIGATVLVLAASLPADAIERPRRALGIAAGLAATVVGLAVTLAWMLRDVLPAAYATPPVSPRDLALLDQHPTLIGLEVVTACLWAVSAVLFTRTGVRTADPLTLWLGVACALSAVSHLNYTLVPSHFTELLYLGDYFFLASVVVLLVAAVRAIGVAESARIDGALYAERRRIARQMHDGVTQELVFISTQTQNITFANDVERADQALKRIQDAVERALDQSRWTIKELSGPVHEPLSSAIAATADIVGRAGTRVELHMDESVTVTPDVRSALLSITREAVHRAIRMDGAENVRIDLWGNGTVGLRITDDGTGVHDGVDASMTLLSIRERASAIDGRLIVTSPGGGGTMLEVLVP